MQGEWVEGGVEGDGGKYRTYFSVLSEGFQEKNIWDDGWGLGRFGYERGTRIWERVK